MLVCVYAAIGQKASTVAQAVTILRRKKCISYTVIVAANASDPATLQYLAPYTGAAIAEYFMYKGRATLVIYDDLTKQAKLTVKCHYYYVVHQVVKHTQVMYSIYIHVY